MKVFDHFDTIRIINLPHRTDRRRDMDTQLARLGMRNDPRIRYFDAIRPPDAGPFTSIGAHGVYMGQKTILAEAASMGHSVLILEDDCAFIPGAQNYDMPADWDIFYGGYTARQPNDLMASDIEGAHMMGFSINGAKAVSAYLDNLKPDGIHPPIDAAYVWFRRAYPDIPTHFAQPILAGQRASRSDIADLNWYDRVPVIRNIANMLRTLKR